MEIPAEFRRLASLFDFEIRDSVSPKSELIEFAVDQLTKDEMTIVSDFLVDLLKSKMSTQEMHKLWMQSGARVAFSDCRLVFCEIVERINNYPK